MKQKKETANKYLTKIGFTYYWEELSEVNVHMFVLFRKNVKIVITLDFVKCISTFLE